MAATQRNLQVAPPRNGPLEAQPEAWRHHHSQLEEEEEEETTEVEAAADDDDDDDDVQVSKRDGEIIGSASIKTAVWEQSLILKLMRVIYT